MIKRNQSPLVLNKDPFNTTYLKQDLKGRSARGGAITVFSQACKVVLRVISTVVLARLLTPADFGLLAMVATFTGFASVFSNFGLSSASIQKSDINHDQVSALFWVNTGLGVFVTVIVASLAPLIAWFFHEPRLTLITVALSITFVFSGLSVQHLALLQRHMRFIEISIVEIFAIAFSVAVAILASYLGAGYWSLVIMNISLAVAAAIGYWLFCPWIPGQYKKGIGIKQLLRFGGDVSGFNFVNFFARNADNILIGKYLGSEALGIYSKAYNLLLLPIRQINVPFSRVVYPALCNLKSDTSKYKAYYLKVISIITLVTAPLIIFMVVSAHELILIMLGNQWLEASTIFSILGVNAFIQPLYYTQGWLHMSSGESRRYLRWGIFSSVLIVLSFIIGLPYGTVGVAISYTVVFYILLIPGMWYAGKSAKISLHEIFSAVWKNWLASALTGGIVYAVTLVMFDLNPILKLTLILLLVIVVNSIFLILLYRGYYPFILLKSLVSLLKKSNTSQ